MGDLDANGNVVYTNHATYDARRKSNILDTRREVATAPQYFDLGTFGQTVAGPNMDHGGMQTIYDLTGVTYASHGIEIIHHGGTYSSADWSDAFTHQVVCGIIDQGGATGNYKTVGITNLFFVTSVSSSDAVATGMESTDSIFLPVHNMDQVIVGTVPIEQSGIINISQIYEHTAGVQSATSRIHVRIH